MFLDVPPGVDPRPYLRDVATRAHPEHLGVGVGPRLVHALGAAIPGLRDLPSPAGPAGPMPSTPTNLLLWVAGDDPGVAFHRMREALRPLEARRATDSVLAFRHRTGHDLSGFEDGTENPTGEKAVATALLSGFGPGIDGSSIAAVQRWVHDFEVLNALSDSALSAIVGRDRVTNEELPQAPASAHVKRVTQEDFDPPAFLLRRSMPWVTETEAGLLFIAYARSLDPFEALLRRMVGLDDGVIDGLFQFTKPRTGASFWCPPLHEGRLDLRALGI